MGKGCLPYSYPLNYGAPGMHGWVSDIIDAVGTQQVNADGVVHAFSRDSPTTPATRCA